MNDMSNTNITKYLAQLMNLSSAENIRNLAYSWLQNGRSFILSLKEGSITMEPFNTLVKELYMDYQVMPDLGRDRMAL